MAHLAEFYQDWKQHNGKRVAIDGIWHKIIVSEYDAIYPYKARVIDVIAEPELWNDWVIDLLASFETGCEVLSQLERHSTHTVD